eukprot:2735277-Amphidinium_carterae.1
MQVDPSVFCADISSVAAKTCVGNDFGTRYIPRIPPCIVTVNISFRGMYVQDKTSPGNGKPRNRTPPQKYPKT